MDPVEYDKKVAAEGLLEISRGAIVHTVPSSTLVNSESDDLSAERLPSAPKTKVEDHRPSAYMMSHFLADLIRHKQETPVDQNIDVESEPVSLVEHAHTAHSHRMSLKTTKKAAGRIRKQGVTVTPLSHVKVTKGAKTVSPRPLAGLGSKKIHECSYPQCGKIYGKSSHLKTHLRTHTGKKKIYQFAFSITFYNTL